MNVFNGINQSQSEIGQKQISLKVGSKTTMLIHPAAVIQEICTDDSSRDGFQASIFKAEATK